MPEITVSQPRQSHVLRNIFILIIIGLLLWEYVIPLGFEVKTPSDYINETLFADNTQATYFIRLHDSTTGEDTDLLIPASSILKYEYWTKLETYHEYTVSVVFNCNANIFGEFRLLWLYAVYDEGVGTDQYPQGITIAGYTPLYSHEVRIDNNFTLNYDNDYSYMLDLKFYNEEGNLLKYSNAQDIPIETGYNIYFEGSNIPKSTERYYN